MVDPQFRCLQSAAKLTCLPLEAKQPFTNIYSMGPSTRNSLDTALSKTLSWLLRHGAVQEGLPISIDGFVDIGLILSHKTFSERNCRAEDIFRVVGADAKNRYTLRKNPQTGKFLIKANQGHSLSEVTESGLQRISDPNQVPVVVHGTYIKNWDRIKREGLRRMNRNHIHFARTDDLRVLSAERISGLRKNCEILVYVNAAAAMNAGIEFFMSENQVILSGGLNGVIAPEFFQKVLDRKSGKQQDEAPWRKSIATPTAAPARKEDLSTKCKTCEKNFPTLQACLAHEMMHLTMGTKPKVDKKKRKRRDLDFSQDDETQEQKEFKLLVKTTLLICEEGNELNILCRLFQPNPENLNLVYDRVHFDLQEELNKRGKWEIEAFGSTITGMAFKWSDIDFYVENKNGNQPTRNTLQRVARILQASNRFSQVLSIHSARVPIIKCTHNMTGYSVDINVSSKFGVYNSKFIANVLSYDQRVHPLMLIIKIWASSWGLTRTGRMTNYCLTWMVFFYLQKCRPPILPSVREFQKNIPPHFVNGVNFAINMTTKVKTVNIQNIKEVVAGFFKFYANYDFSSFVICPYSGKSVPRSQFQTNPDALLEYNKQLELFAQNECKNSPDFQCHPLNLNTLMVVQDPFVLNQNKSTTVGPRVFTKLTKQLAKGHTIFAEHPSRTPSSSTLLLQLFYEQDEDKSADVIIPGEQKLGKPSVDKKNQCRFSPIETELIYVRNYLRKNFPNQTFDKMEVNKFWTEKIVEFTGDVLQNYFKVTMSSLRKIGSKAARTVGQSDVYSNKYTVNCELSASIDNWSWRKNEIKRGYAAYLKEQMEITNRFDTERSTTNYPTNLHCTFCLKPENDFSAVNIIMEDLFSSKSGFKTFFTEFTVRMRNFYKALFEGLCRA